MKRKRLKIDLSDGPQATRPKPTEIDEPNTSESSLQRSICSLVLQGVAGWNELGSGARVGFWPGHLGQVDLDLFQRFQKELPWQQHNVRIMGRSIPQPRLVAYYALDESLSYTYSGEAMAQWRMVAAWCMVAACMPTQPAPAIWQQHGICVGSVIHILHYGSLQHGSRSVMDSR